MYFTEIFCRPLKYRPQEPANRLCGFYLARLKKNAHFLFARHRAKKEQQVALLL
jgi:hypothetical protein